MAEYRVNTGHSRLSDARLFAMRDKNFTQAMKDTATALNFHRNALTGEWSYRLEYKEPVPVKPAVKSITVHRSSPKHPDKYQIGAVTLGLQVVSNPSGDLHILGQYRWRHDEWVTIGEYLCGSWTGVEIEAAPVPEEEPKTVDSAVNVTTTYLGQQVEPVPISQSYQRKPVAEAVLVHQGWNPGTRRFSEERMRIQRYLRALNACGYWLVKVQQNDDTDD